MKKLFAVFLFLAMFFFAPLVEANGWLSGYYNRIKIPIDASKVDAALSNFPVLVKLTSANFDFSKANSDGYDFRFTSDDGTTLLKYERERHDSTNKLAEYWVKVPSISDSVDTYIYLYYRTEDTADGADPENVWDSNFKSVHHLKDATTSTVLDSTSNNNDGTKKAANEPAQADGKIGKAQDFDGTDDYIDCGNGSSLDITEAITLEAWIYPSDLTSGERIISKGLDNNGVYYIYRDTNGKLHMAINDIGWNDVGAEMPSSNQWYYVVGTYNGTNRKLFINDVEKYSIAQSGAINTNTKNVTIGCNGDTSEGQKQFFKGKIDKVRISNVARSAAWIKASYHAGDGSLLKSFTNETLYGNFFLMFF